TGTPKEMRWWGEDLAGRGYTVLAPRLAGHATTPKDMLRTRWWDWLSSVEDAYNYLKGMTDTQVLMGLSLGGALALIGASIFPAAGVVAVSAPNHLPADPRLPFARPLSLLVPNTSKGAPDWHNPDAAKDHAEYPTYPTRAIAELNDCLKELRARLPLITIPALLIHSKKDHGVPPENAETNLKQLGSKQKEIFWVENSGHVIPREPDRQLAFNAAAAFISQLSKNT
ncbi:MAG: alpha/beta fold hydrolase, partial [Anaerolineaceae bacterium]|nr:alpha/beta fold hydrolase [Anaerolineaceae bacterium]